MEQANDKKPLPCKRKKRPTNLDLSKCTSSQPKKEVQPKKKRKMGPYDPQVYHAVEELLKIAEETEVEISSKGLNHIAPLEKLEEGELPLSQEPVCPRHLLPLDNCHSQMGWNYRKCQIQPCILFCGADQHQVYMNAVMQDIHPDLLLRWDHLKCFCKKPATLNQSWSQKNPNRLYLRCSRKDCKFFRRADEPVLPYDLNDPYSVHTQLMEPLPGAPPVNGHYSKDMWLDKKNFPKLQPEIPINTYKSIEDMSHLPHWTDFYDDGPTLNDAEGPAPAPPPPKYSESMVDFQKRSEMVEIDPPYEAVHKDVKDRALLGLF